MHEHLGYDKALKNIDPAAYTLLDTAETPAYTVDEVAALKEDLTYEDKTGTRNEQNPAVLTEEFEYRSADFAADRSPRQLVSIALEKLEDINELDGEMRDHHTKKIYEQTLKAVAKAAGEYAEEHDVDVVSGSFDFGGHLGFGPIQDTGLQMVRREMRRQTRTFEQGDLYGPDDERGWKQRNAQEQIGMAHQRPSEAAEKEAQDAFTRTLSNE